jgi:hypothetical protein
MKYEIRGASLDISEAGTSLVLDIITVDPAAQKVINIPLTGLVVSEAINAAFLEQT